MNILKIFLPRLFMAGFYYEDIPDPICKFAVYPFL